MNRPWQKVWLALSTWWVLVPALCPAADKPPEYPRTSANSDTEAKAKILSLARAGEFLDSVGVNWTRTRKCGTCHTNYAYMMGRPSRNPMRPP
jgi:squalene-hopene/tetraprenyl-beta-curcumene cyclase